MSRKPEHLHPKLRDKWEQLRDLCKRVGVDLMLTHTYRSNEEQDELYAQGRTKPGRIVTHARGGQSAHNHVDDDGNPAALAFDVAIVKRRGRGGKPVELDWGGPWSVVGEIGKHLCGLKWGGDWKRIKDRPHFYITEGR